MFSLLMMSASRGAGRSTIPSIEVPEGAELFWAGTPSHRPAFGLAVQTVHGTSPAFKPPRLLTWHARRGRLVYAGARALP